MKKTLHGLLCTVILCFGWQLSTAQNVEWLLSENGQTNPPNRAINAICHDNAGNILIAGSFSFGSGFTGYGPYAPTVAELQSFNISNSVTLQTRGNNDLYLVSLSSDSAVNWIKHIGGAGADFGEEALALTTDNAGNIYMAASYGDSMWIDNYSLTHTGTPAPGFRNDIFITKISAAGNVQWLKQVSSYDMEHARDIAVDTAGDVYVCGAFETSNTDFGDGMPVANTGENDGFLCKYNGADGSLVWKKIFQDTTWQSESISFLEAGPDGNIYVAGSYTGMAASFDTLLLNPAGIGGSSFIMSLSPSGNVLWNKHIINTIGLAGLKCRNNKVYIAGNHSINVIIPFTSIPTYGSQDVFLAILQASDGSVITTKHYGDAMSNEMLKGGFRVGTDGKIYFTGKFADSMRFDNATITGSINKDIYVAVCDSNGVGEYICMASESGDQWPDALDVDGSGNIYLAGTSLKGIINFGNITIGTPKKAGMFMAKFKPGTQTTGILSPELNSVQLYPNPSSGKVYWTAGDVERVQVYNITGQLVLDKASPQTNYLDIGHLGNGSYIIQLQTTGATIQQLIIKE